MDRVPFFLFQPDLPFTKLGTTLRHTQGREYCRTARNRGGLGGFVNSKRAFLERRLFQISDTVWRIHLEEEGPKMILEKELTKIADCGIRKLKISQSIPSKIRNL